MTLPTRILCPVDFSSCSDQAVHAAIDLAKRSGANVELLHVMQTPAYVLPLMPISGPPVDMLRDLPQRLEQQLNKVRERFVSEHPHIECTVREGTTHTTIVERATETDADLIVMGTHGHTGLTHLMLGSVAERVVRLAPCPVLTVGPGHLSADSTAAPKVLCPVDFSGPSSFSLDYAAAFARGIGASLHITHVVPLLAYALASKEPVDDPGFASRVRDNVDERLAQLQKQYSDDKLAVTVSSIEGVPYEGIARVADQVGATMIVIGTHGHTGWNRLMLGSVAEKVVRTARIPVLAVRPRAAESSK